MKDVVLRVDDSFGAEYAGDYVFQAISWARYMDIVEKHTTYDQTLGVLIRQDRKGLQADLVMASLKTQPAGNPITYERLVDKDASCVVPPMLGMKLVETAGRVNGLTAQEKKTSGSESTETK